MLKTSKMKININFILLSLIMIMCLKINQINQLQRRLINQLSWLMACQLVDINQLGAINPCYDEVWILSLFWSCSKHVAVRCGHHSQNLSFRELKCNRGSLGYRLCLLTEYPIIGCLDVRKPLRLRKFTFPEFGPRTRDRAQRSAF